MNKSVVLHLLWILMLLVSDNDSSRKWSFLVIVVINCVVLAVDASYNGPKINEETKKVDLPFVKSLVQHFKDQKKIHKKYAFMVILFYFCWSV